ncbi:hypothetical protein N8D56_01530 [Devosia sp. A8/3-2]|nr:hypothetical protein N8D56_01530 [Devosia sp. A8/3-2]
MTRLAIWGVAAFMVLAAGPAHAAPAYSFGDDNGDYSTMGNATIRGSMDRA